VNAKQHNTWQSVKFVQSGRLAVSRFESAGELRREGRKVDSPGDVLSPGNIRKLGDEPVGDATADQEEANGKDQEHDRCD
jgi:hypothetical protein